MNIKIDIWCKGLDIYGNKVGVLFTSRVPSDIQLINADACKEIIRRRIRRIDKINRHRKKLKKDLIKLEGFKIQTLEDSGYKILLDGWSPVISREVLEFICKKL